MDPARVTMFAGHYGSGKSNAAVNFAIAISGRGRAVTIADLDIVNPYYRSKDCAGMLRSAGVRLISSEYANSNVDMPAIPAEANAITDDREGLYVVDVGGDDQGALALGRYADALRAEGDYDLFLVINRYRPSTRTPEEVAEVRREIEAACRLSFTGIVNNSNLGVETDAETVLSSVPFAEACARLTALPLRMTCVWDRLAPELEGRVEHLLPMTLSNLQESF